MYNHGLFVVLVGFVRKYSIILTYMERTGSMEKNIRVIKTDEEFKILADPYRIKILNCFNDTTETYTVKQIATKLGEVPAKVHYHVKKLLSIHILELDHIEIINGIHAKYYRFTADELKFGVREDLQGPAKALKLDQITKVLLFTIDSFKDEVIEYAEQVREDDFPQNRSGYLTNPHIYLTKEEKDEFREYVESFLKNHQQKKEGTTKYSTIFGLMSKKE